MSRFAKEFVIYGVSGALSKIIMVFLVPIYTRVLTPSDYGILGFIATMATALNILCDLQITMGMGRFFFEEETQRSRRVLVGTGLVSVFTNAMVAGLLVMAFAAPLARKIFGGSEHAAVLRLMAAQIPASVCHTYLLYVLRLRRNPRQYLACALTSTVTTVFLSVLLVLVLRWGVHGVLWAQLVGMSVGAAMCSFYGIDTLRLSWSRPRLNRILRFCLPSVPAVAGNWLQNATGQVFVLSMLSLADLGNDSLALRLASALGLYQMAFNMAWYPFALSIMKEGDSRRKYALGFLAYLCGASAIAFPLGLLASDIVGLLAGPDFQQAGGILGIVGLAVLGEGMVATGSFGIMVTKRTYHYSTSYAVSVMVNVGITLALIRSCGGLAVALGLMAGRWTHAGIALAISQRLYPVKHDYSKIGTVLAVALSGVALTVWVPSMPFVLKGLFILCAWAVIGVVAVTCLPLAFLEGLPVVQHLLPRLRRTR